MRLLLDIGNTSVQFLACEEEGLSQAAIYKISHKNCLHQSLRAMSNQLDTCAISTVFVASVLSSEENQVIKEQLSLIFQVPIFIYSAESERLGFRNSYAQPACLGVDRWLAILEAWHRRGACAVIDCGSAITVDVADEQGQHLGGYIVPGHSMLIDSLFHGTGQVKVTPSWSSHLELANSTFEAVNRGSIKMCTSFINETIKSVMSTHPGTAIFLTGGDAERFAEFVEWPLLMDNTLVLGGLNRVATDILEGLPNCE